MGTRPHHSQAGRRIPAELGPRGQTQGWAGQTQLGRDCGTPGCRNLGAHGGRQSLAEGPGGCWRVQTWCSLPGAQDMCMVLSALCPAPGVQGLLFPTDLWSAVPPPSPCLLPRTSVVPVLVPVSRAQCPVHGTQCWCWCLWVVLVAVLVSVPAPDSGDSAWWHCLLCGVHCALWSWCHAHAGAGIHCWCPVPATSDWCWFGASVLVVLPGAQCLCPVPTSPCPLPPVQCQMSLSWSGPSASWPVSLSTAKCPLSSAWYRCPVPCGPCFVPVSHGLGCSVGVVCRVLGAAGW